MYVLVADDTDKVYTSTHTWRPQLYDYQAKGTNTLFLTFLNPARMPDVPPAFAALAKSRGTGSPGAVPNSTTVMFAIGGQAYSERPNPWDWLTSTAKAEAMAAEVALWPSKYGCDGIDLDIETGAGNAAGAGRHLVEFVIKLKQLNPSMVVTQPVFGSPSSVPAANILIAAAYNASRPAWSTPALGSVAKVGIMVYSGTGSEQWTQYYTDGCSAHCSQSYCPLPACVARKDMVLGIEGSAASGEVLKISSDVKTNGFGGVMIWYASLLDPATGKSGLVYGNMDASTAKEAAWEAGLKAMQEGA